MLEPMLKAPFIRRSGGSADNRRMKPLRSIAALAALLLCVGISPFARGGDHDDHERARAAVQAGEVLPLPALLERLHRSFPGQVLDLELEHEQGRWIYEIKLLQPDGQLLKLEVDARTAQVLQVKRKDDRKARYRPQP